MRSTFRCLATALALAGAPVTGARAQATTPRSTTEESVRGGIVTGLLGFGLGALAGGAIGGCSRQDCDGLFYGGAVGGTLGMALGVHVGNDSRGNFPLDAVTGALVWILGIGISGPVHTAPPLIPYQYLVVPVIQLGAMVVVEQLTGGREASPPSATEGVSLRVSPTVYRNRLGVGGSVVF